MKTLLSKDRIFKCLVSILFISLPTCTNATVIELKNKISFLQEENRKYKEEEIGEFQELRCEIRDLRRELDSKSSNISYDSNHNEQERERYSETPNGEREGEEDITKNPIFIKRTNELMESNMEINRLLRIQENKNAELEKMLKTIDAERLEFGSKKREDIEKMETLCNEYEGYLENAEGNIQAIPKRFKEISEKFKELYEEYEEVSEFVEDMKLKQRRSENRISKIMENNDNLKKESQKLKETNTSIKELLKNSKNFAFESSKLLDSSKKCFARSKKKLELENRRLKELLKTQGVKKIIDSLNKKISKLETSESKLILSNKALLKDNVSLRARNSLNKKILKDLGSESNCETLKKVENKNKKLQEENNNLRVSCKSKKQKIEGKNKTIIKNLQEIKEGEDECVRLEKKRDELEMSIKKWKAITLLSFLSSIIGICVVGWACNDKRSKKIRTLEYENSRYKSSANNLNIACLQIVDSSQQYINLECNYKQKRLSENKVVLEYFNSMKNSIWKLQSSQNCINDDFNLKLRQQYSQTISELETQLEEAEKEKNNIVSEQIQSSQDCSHSEAYNNDDYNKLNESYFNLQEQFSDLESKNNGTISELETQNNNLTQQVQNQKTEIERLNNNDKTSSQFIYQENPDGISWNLYANSFYNLNGFYSLPNTNYPFTSSSANFEDLQQQYINLERNTNSTIISLEQHLQAQTESHQQQIKKLQEQEKSSQDEINRLKKQKGNTEQQLQPQQTAEQTSWYKKILIGIVSTVTTLLVYKKAKERSIKDALSDSGKSFSQETEFRKNNEKLNDANSSLKNKAKKQQHLNTQLQEDLKAKEKEIGNLKNQNQKSNTKLEHQKRINSKRQKSLKVKAVEASRLSIEVDKLNDANSSLKNKAKKQQHLNTHLQKKKAKESFKKKHENIQPPISTKITKSNLSNNNLFIFVVCISSVLIYFFCIKKGTLAMIYREYRV